jgi:hypothetical protein
MDKWTAISIWLSILALVLSVPFGVAGTLLAPKVQVWWATTSKKRSSRRIRRLQRRIRYLEKVTEWAVLPRLIVSLALLGMAAWLLLLLMSLFLNQNLLYLFAHNGFRLEDQTITDADI